MGHERRRLKNINKAEATRREINTQALRSKVRVVKLPASRSVADPDHFHSDPDKTFHFDADPTADPALHQTWCNLRPLIYWPSLHGFICQPSDSTVSEIVGFKPRTVATFAWAFRYFRLDLIHTDYLFSTPFSWYSSVGGQSIFKSQVILTRKCQPFAAFRNRFWGIKS